MKIPSKYTNKPLKDKFVFAFLSAQVIADCMSVETFVKIYDYIDNLENKAGLK